MYLILSKGLFEPFQTFSGDQTGKSYEVIDKVTCITAVSVPERSRQKKLHYICTDFIVSSVIQ